MLSENIVGAPDVDSKLRKHDPASEVDEIESVVNAAGECRQVGHGTRRKFKVELHGSLKRSFHHEVSLGRW